MNKTLFIILLLSFSFLAHAQKILKGTVLDEKGAVVPKASVFLNNTSIGTMADEEGKFSLAIPQGKFELIVSSVGFVTANQTINAAEMANFITIKLFIKAPELESVIIEPNLKDGWERWGQFFLTNFIGSSSLADDCRILNKEVLRFRESKKKGLLTVTALEPLVIENKALGYRIRYQLESFTYTFANRYILFTGYPFFEKMEGKNRKQNKWEKARNDAYYGSQMHFMRSVFRNVIAEEGFEVRSLKRIPNTEKQRVKRMYSHQLKTFVSSAGAKTIQFDRANDSADYYASVMTKPDYAEMIGQNILPGDSVAFAVDSVTAGLEFQDYLLVIYKRAQVRPEYSTQFPKSGKEMMSQLYLMAQNRIQIQANGMYYNPADILSLGYWAWSEKISSMLPFDFNPTPIE